MAMTWNTRECKK